jgi:SAM-dependent methyltransferase
MRENAINEALESTETDLNRMNYPYALEYFHFHRHRFRDILKKVVELKKEVKISDAGLTVLEVGSFVGCLTIACNHLGFKSCGIDLEKYISKINFSRDGLEYKACDLKNELIPYNDEAFDLVIFSEVLEHLDFHPLDLFQELSRVLKKDGKIIITTPNFKRLNNRIKLLLGREILEIIPGAHYREFTLPDILHLLDKSGLRCTGNVDENFAYFDFPERNVLIKWIDKIAGATFPNLSSNIFVTAVKK